MPSKASSFDSIIRLFSSEMEMCSISVLYKTWTNAWICCGVAVFKRNWRWWAGQSANSWKKPRLLFTTRNIATKWTHDGGVQSFIEPRDGKKKRVGGGKAIKWGGGKTIEMKRRRGSEKMEIRGEKIEMLWWWWRKSTMEIRWWWWWWWWRKPI